MALKSVLETLDDVPEALHEYYEENDDGKFVLKMEGVDEHPEVAALRNAHQRQKEHNQNLKKDKDALEAKQKELPEDFSAEEWHRLKELEAEIEEESDDPDPDDPDGKGKKNKKDPKDKLQNMRKLTEQKIARQEEKHTEEIKKKDEEIAEKDRVIENLLVDDGLTKALVENNVSNRYLKGAKALLRDSVKVISDDGEYRAVVETEDEGEVDLAKFVGDWAGSDEGKAYVEQPAGGGSQGAKNAKDTKNNPWTQETFNLTEQGRLIREDPKRAEQLMRAAGVSDADINRKLGRG